MAWLQPLRLVAGVEHGVDRCGGNIINDYFDTRIDRINKPDEVIVGRTVKRRAL
ncbi:MAG: hypothetical protein IPI00_17715 [Flavobacteriales bacterium]|nr:hypothetical protein [Flavobacteriales bacterium]